MGNNIAIIGTGMGFSDLTESHLRIIRDADILIGGKRHLSMFEELSIDKIPVDKNLFEIIQVIEKEKDHKKIVVLASGDPLYFGIGSYLSKKSGYENVRIFPNINSVASAFSKIKESWNDAYSLSLHGREFKESHLNIFMENRKIAVFTDEKNTPSFIAEKLLENGIDWFKVHVFENMGQRDERQGCYSLSEAKDITFSYLNLSVFISEKEPQMKKMHFGLPEEDYHHDNGLITKSEVRAVTLSRLMLNENSVLWDLGAGSGSVSIEASNFVRSGRIISVEKDEKRIEIIRKNKTKFVSPIEIVKLSLPDGMENLPDPDRVFIGGGGKNLEKIVDTAIKRLDDKGIIVVNTVILKSLETTLKVFENNGITPDIVQLQVNRGEPIAGEIMMKSLNPVWIISGKRKKI